MEIKPKKRLARAIVKEWDSYYESLKYFSSEHEAAEFFSSNEQTIFLWPHGEFIEVDDE
jgi:hypothetical protein